MAESNWSKFARQLVGGVGGKKPDSDRGSADNVDQDKLMSEASSHSIDIGKQQIGTVYAKALLGAASAASDDSAESVVEELGKLVSQVIDKMPNFQSVLESPRISVEEKTAILDRSLKGRVSETVLRFLKVVCEHGRLDCLSEIYQEARRLHNESKRVVQVKITTAITIDAKVYRRVLEQLREKFGKELDVETYVDPKLIGGIVVRVGDKVFDGSVAQKMQSLREEAVAKAVEKMRNATDQFATSS